MKRCFFNHCIRIIIDHVLVNYYPTYSKYFYEIDAMFMVTICELNKCAST